MITAQKCMECERLKLINLQLESRVTVLKSHMDALLDKLSEKDAEIDRQRNLRNMP